MDTGPERGDRLRRVLVVVLIAATVLNIATLPFGRVKVRPVWRHPAGDLATIIQTDDDATAWRYGIYAELGRHGRGGTIVVPTGSWFDSYTARNLAGVAVIERDFDPSVTLPAGLRPLGELELVEGDDRPIFVYWRIPGPPAYLFWLGETAGGFVLVPDSVLPVPGSTDG